MIPAFLTTPLGMRLAGGLLLALVIGSTTLYIKHLHGEVAELNASLGAEQAANEVLSAELKSAKDVFKWYQGATSKLLKDAGAENGKLSKEYQAARDKVDELADVLAKHDLKYLAEKKPGLVSKSINAGTERVFRDIEKTTRDFADRNSKPADVK